MKIVKSIGVMGLVLGILTTALAAEV